MTKPKPQIQLGRGEHIVAAVPEYTSGPDWTNSPLWVYIDAQGKLCSECTRSSTRLWNNGCYSRWVRRFRGS